MKFQFLILYIILLLGGAVWGINQVSKQEKEPKTAGQFSYLALGDSYTVGESVDYTRAWPNQLLSALVMNNVPISKFKMVAKTGWRTDEMLKSAKKTIKKEKFDLVSLLIGVNNEFQGQDPEEFEPQFLECLEFAIDHSVNGSEGVFVLSIPDYAYTPFGKENKSISERINNYNAVCARISKQKGVAYFDITAISRNGLKDPSFVASDGLHPSATQYKIWVNSFLYELVTQIKQNL
ncbi:SGNH/GDSL hydrolase family protein [Crocinitomix sp.]|nr:SGNH/GDSL hydrolase family protein [Crocinitomix sp.]